MITAAIIGASGYSGAELLRLLANRADVHVKKVTARTFAGKKVEELYPLFSGRVGLEYEPLSGELDGVDVAFIALPSGEAMNIVPRLLPSVGRIIDLGGDFWLKSRKLPPGSMILPTEGRSRGTMSFAAAMRSAKNSGSP